MQECLKCWHLLLIIKQLLKQVISIPHKPSAPSTLCAWAVEKMWFFTGFRFPLVLCIEDMENLIGMSLRKCKCVLTRCFQVQLNHVFKRKPLFSLCIHLPPLHLLLVFVVPLENFLTFQVLTDQMSQPDFIIPLSGFSFCPSVSHLFHPGLSSLLHIFLLHFFVLWHGIFHFHHHWIFVSSKAIQSFVAHASAFLVFQATFSSSLFITLKFGKHKILK